MILIAMPAMAESDLLGTFCHMPVVGIEARMPVPAPSRIQIQALMITRPRPVATMKRSRLSRASRSEQSEALFGVSGFAIVAGLAGPIRLWSTELLFVFVILVGHSVLIPGDM